MKFRIMAATLVAFVATVSMSFAASFQASSYSEIIEVDFKGEIFGTRKKVKFTPGLLNKNLKYVWHVDVKIDSFETPYTIDPMFTQWLNHSKDELSARIRMESDYEGERPGVFMQAHGQMYHNGEYRETLLAHRKTMSRGIKGPLKVQGVLRIRRTHTEKYSLTSFTLPKWRISFAAECVPNTLTGPNGTWTATEALLATEDHDETEHIAGQ